MYFFLEWKDRILKKKAGKSAYLHISYPTHAAKNNGQVQKTFLKKYIEENTWVHANMEFPSE